MASADVMAITKCSISVPEKSPAREVRGWSPALSGEKVHASAIAQPLLEAVVLDLVNPGRVDWRPPRWGGKVR
jgi:hypothetical protein